MSDGGAVFWGQIFILVTLVANAIITWLRDGRNRKWEMEDRRARFERVEKKLDENTQLTVDTQNKVDQNTIISVQAFKEANDVNKKIADIGSVRLTGSPDDRKSK